VRSLRAFAVSVCEQNGDEHVGQPVLVGVWVAARLCDMEDVEFRGGQCPECVCGFGHAGAQCGLSRKPLCADAGAASRSLLMPCQRVAISLSRAAVARAVFSNLDGLTRFLTPLLPAPPFHPGHRSGI
jgi:hypothetical protein